MSDADIPAWRGCERDGATCACACASARAATDPRRRAPARALGRRRAAARRPRRAPRPPPSCAARAARPRTATARPCRSATRAGCRSASGRGRGSQSISSQKHWTTGSGPPNGRICSTPVMMPSTPMKRVSRPTRIALSETNTIASASASAPGQPEQLGEQPEPARRDVRRRVDGAVAVEEVADRERRSRSRTAASRSPGGRRRRAAARRSSCGSAGPAGADRARQVGQRPAEREVADRDDDARDDDRERAVVVVLGTCRSAATAAAPTGPGCSARVERLQHAVARQVGEEQAAPDRPDEA